jgi:hypothetical protein
MLQQQQHQHPALARAAMEQQQQQLQQQSSFQAFGGDPAAVAAAWGARQRSYDGASTCLSPSQVAHMPHTETFPHPACLVAVVPGALCKHTHISAAI